MQVLDNVSTPAKAPRLISIDIFRGLNIALMIFVNELAEIKGLPWWTYHAPGKVDVMTYVDMVFPAFLVIIGMSLPFAINARLRRGDRLVKLTWYIVLRAAALTVLGIIIANGSQGSAALMHGMGPFAWALLALAGAFLVWLDYPALSNTRYRKRHKLLQVAGVALLVTLGFLFRQSGHQGISLGLSYDYPEILGLIGYTYFVTAICYVLTVRYRWAPVGWFLAFLALNITSAAKLFSIHQPWWKWPPQNGSMGVLVFSGIVLTTIFSLDPRLSTLRMKICSALAFGALAAVTAWLLLPLGLSKIRATPAWVLFTVAACCVIYAALYALCEQRGYTAWALPVRSAGSNTLLTYLLPDLWYYGSALVGFTWWSRHFTSGIPGVARAIVFTAFTLAISKLLTNLRLRLQL